MIKQLKKYFVIVISAVILITTAPAYADTTSVDTLKTQQSVEMPSKKPIGKKQLALKFIMAMIGVGVSSVIIYVLLALYNKFMYGGITRTEPSEEDNDFKTPTNMKEALRIFLKKTK